jgi:MFS family permease
MYPLEPKRLFALREERWSGVGPNVLFLGLTSMLTDISSEMVTAVLPIYLVFALGLTPLQFGFIDGLSQAAAAVARLASGLLADRWQRNREVAAAGYGISAISKLMLLAAGNSWGLLSGAVALDRVGKGIRTSPRDALISLSCTPARVGLAFGVHRALDTFGALLGPLVAFAILALLTNAFDLVFFTSFCFALVGLATLMCFVKNVPAIDDPDVASRLTVQSVLRLFARRPFRILVGAGFVLGLMTVADAFFFLLIQRKMSMQSASFPLLYAATASTYLVLAIPAGRLGDRLGRGRVFLLGHALLVLGCLVLWLATDELTATLLSLALLGAYYACTDGVLMAAASAVLPADMRTTGLAILATATGLARMAASFLFGAVWSAYSAETAMAAFALGMTVAMIITARPLMRLKEVP